MGAIRSTAVAAVMPRGAVVYVHDKATWDAIPLTDLVPGGFTKVSGGDYPVSFVWDETGALGGIPRD